MFSEIKRQHSIDEGARRVGVERRSRRIGDRATSSRRRGADIRPRASPSPNDSHVQSRAGQVRLLPQSEETVSGLAGELTSRAAGSG